MCCVCLVWYFYYGGGLLYGYFLEFFFDECVKIKVLLVIRYDENVLGKINNVYFLVDEEFVGFLIL